MAAIAQPQGLTNLAQVLTQAQEIVGRELHQWQGALPAPNATPELPKITAAVAITGG